MYEIQRASCVPSAAAARLLACRALLDVVSARIVGPRWCHRLPGYSFGAEVSPGRSAIVRRQRDLYALQGRRTRASAKQFRPIFAVHMMSTSRWHLSPGLPVSSTLCPRACPQQARYSARGMGTRAGVSKVTVRLSADEIAVVCNCINEALDALTDDDFQMRVGADRQQARALLGRLDERRTAAKRAAEV